MLSLGKLHFRYLRLLGKYPLKIRGGGGGGGGGAIILLGGHLLVVWYIIGTVLPY